MFNELRRHGAVLIIMVTARSERHDCLRGLQLGVDDYIFKPFSPMRWSGESARFWNWKARSGSSAQA
ncbi:TPA: response regulator [Stenotrophomonas maltophilia]|uniref:response regulator n=1 Tax=Stenotrophomonas maltophilia TaxID=40324 RepID=UPI001B317F9C|nr:response regulator [Stenotrophomonas maltophilia]HDS1835439.1 response regulator [Stenotrophomonas maltophilia]